MHFCEGCLSLGWVSTRISIRRALFCLFNICQEGRQPVRPGQTAMRKQGHSSPPFQGLIVSPIDQTCLQLKLTHLLK
jgi:hypothetical protein